MSYKHSIFNFEYKRNADENVVYNTYSKALVLFTDSDYENYKGITALKPEDISDLIDNGIIMPEDYDELAFLKYIHYKTKFANDTMFLTIAPTLDCNFACPYCYENRRKGKMSPEVQDALVEYVKNTIGSGVNNFNVTWYGGEPLMYFDIVESLAGRISQCCQETGCLLNMEIVTNGYLLTSEMIEKLDQLGISKVQITLDGLKEHHDVRRPLRNGEGTFDKIVSNLSLFADSPIGVLVRMNVDNENAADYSKLKQLIDSLDNPNIRVYASPVEDINKDTINEVSDFMTTEEFESFALHSCEDGSMSDDDFSVMDDRYCFCTAETENCYVVDDHGDFYKCWDEVGRKEYCCFNILDPDNVNYAQIAKFLTVDPFADEKCRNCVFMPLCFGGCKFQRTHLNKSVCGFTEETIIKYLETTFFR